MLISFCTDGATSWLGGIAVPHSAPLLPRWALRVGQMWQRPRCRRHRAKTLQNHPEGECSPSWQQPLLLHSFIEAIIEINDSPTIHHFVLTIAGSAVSWEGAVSHHLRWLTEGGRGWSGNIFLLTDGGRGRHLALSLPLGIIYYRYWNWSPRGHETKGMRYSKIAAIILDP